MQQATSKPELFMLSDEAQQNLPQEVRLALDQVDKMKYFLISAPVEWKQDQYIRRFLLPSGEYVSCVLWNNLFHISGTDIVRCLAFRFQAFGRPVKNSKKFEEGIFSDLRNLKAGTDASLEEPKSAFLDFLYKNNCIRTQKKQKVFYWYSVPHDRLFLDALERDLKREKSNQEITTVAVSEPALSFMYDSSQSLYEQMIKHQQTNVNSSLFTGLTGSGVAPSLPSANPAMTQTSPSDSHTSSPIEQKPVRESMGPPPPVPNVQMSNNVLGDLDGSMSSYSTTPIPPTMAQHLARREQDFGAFHYDRLGMPINRLTHRHSSMPVQYMEYSPAPSFVSSHLEDYSNRGISYEPITPPQAMLMSGDNAYIANEDTGLYSVLPEFNPTQTSYGNPVQLAANMFNTNAISQRQFSNNGIYSVIEGSPTYKQRRRRSSIGQNMQAAVAAAQVANAMAHAPMKGSDLRRSVSMSVPPVIEMDESQVEQDMSPVIGPNYQQMLAQQKYMQMQQSRAHFQHSLRQQVNALRAQSQQPQHHHHQFRQQAQNFQGFTQQELEDTLSTNNVLSRPGPFRRARSATMTELGPYPQKAHSCPIPTCGRHFKRLEHLKRHVKTHTHDRPYQCPHCPKSFSRSDNLAQHRRVHEGPNGYGMPVFEEDELDLEENDEEDLDEEDKEDDGLDSGIALAANGHPMNTFGLPMNVNVNTISEAEENALDGATELDLVASPESSSNISHTTSQTAASMRASSAAAAHAHAMLARGQGNPSPSLYAINDPTLSSLASYGAKSPLNLNLNMDMNMSMNAHLTMDGMPLNMGYVGGGMTISPSQMMHRGGNSLLSGTL